MKTQFLKMALLAVGILFGLTAQGQLLISEYVEGSSFNKCIEIYNPGPATVDLGGFGYRGYHNGSATPTYEFTFPAVSLTANQVYVICHPNANVSCSGAADLTDNRLLFNGDDAIAIFDTLTGANIDIFGSIGEDPGSRWLGTCGHRTKDRTLRRKASVSAGVTAASTGFPTLCSEWDEYSNNDCSGLGNPSLEVFTPECNPIISEYVEGGPGFGNCKFLEIYNPCCDSIDLNEYEVSIYFNACSSIYTIPLGGLVAGNKLASGEVIVLYNPLENCTDFSISGSYPANFFADTRVQFNGNDAVVLAYAPLAASVDIVGNICENIVWNGATCAASTENQTLVRNPEVCVGVSVDPVSDFPSLCTEWTEQGVNDVSGLGSHTSTCLEGCANGKQAAAVAPVTSLEVFPNPFSTTTHFRFASENGGQAHLEVFSLSGQKIADLFNGQLEAGEVRTVEFNGEALPAGAYLYRLQTNGGQEFGKVFLTR